MDNKEKLSGSQNNGEVDANSGNQSLNSGTKTGISAKQKVKTKRRRKPNTEKAITVQIVLAIISAITAIVIALLGFPPLIQWLQPEPSPTLVFTATSSPAPTETVVPVTETSSPTASPSPTSTVTITVTASETITLTPAPALIVFIENDRSAGRPPLTVNFDARDSYLIASDGQQYYCRNGACNYTWKVVSDGQKLEKSQLNSSGKFQYTFGKRGRYLISVWICRGKDAVNCGGNGIYIEIG